MTNRREKVETVTDFIFLCSKLTLDCECIHEIKRCLLLGRKAMTNLDNTLKSTDTLPSKACIVKATFFCIFFSVLVYWCELDHKEDWVDVFKLWDWKRSLRVPCTTNRSNQSILKEINPEYSLEELMLKLKLQYFDHLMWTADSLEKILPLGMIEGRRRSRQQRRRWLDGITNSVNVCLSELREIVKDWDHGVPKSRIGLSN